MYIASQVFASIGLVLNIGSRFFKKQHHNLFVNIFATIFTLISYIFLTAYMGMVGLIISTARSITFYLFSKNDWEKKLWLLIFFIVAQFVSCVITSYIDGLIILDFVLIFLKGSLYTYGAWQHNVHIFRWSSIISSSVAIIYNVQYKAYVQILSEALSIVILFYVIIKDKIDSKKLAVAKNNSEISENIISDMTENLDKKDTDTNNEKN